MRTGVLVIASLVLGTSQAQRRRACLPYAHCTAASAPAASFLATGSQGDRLRLDVAIELKPKSRYGVLLAWRAFDAGSSRPHHRRHSSTKEPRRARASSLDLHADVGVDLDQRAPLLGGGIRPTLQLIGPLGLVYDGGAYLILDGVDNSRLQLQSTLLLVARW